MGLARFLARLTPAELQIILSGKDIVKVADVLKRHLTDVERKALAALILYPPTEVEEHHVTSVRKRFTEAMTPEDREVFFHGEDPYEIARVARFYLAEEERQALVLFMRRSPQLTELTVLTALRQGLN